MSWWWFSTSRWTRITLQDGADGILQTKAYSTGVSQKCTQIFINSTCIYYIHMCIDECISKKKWHLHPSFSSRVFPLLRYQNCVCPDELPVCIEESGGPTSGPCFQTRERWKSSPKLTTKSQARTGGYMKVLNLHHWSTCWYLDKIHPWNRTVSLPLKIRQGSQKGNSSSSFLSTIIFPGAMLLNFGGVYYWGSQVKYL